MTRDELLQFMRSEKYAVQTSVSPGGTPQAAVVGIAVSDHFVQRTVQALLRGASTGTVGDGKIFVLPVEKIYRIRTGEEDEAAVTPVTVAKARK